MNAFEALVSGNVAAFTKAIDQHIAEHNSDVTFLALLTNPPHNLTLVEFALDITDPSDAQVECFNVLVKKLAKGNQLPVEAVMRAVTKSNDYKLDISNVPERQLRMFIILLHFYCQSDEALAKNWGYENLEKVKQQFIKAIQAIKENSGCFFGMLTNIHAAVDKNIEINPQYRKEILEELDKKEYDPPSLKLILGCKQNNQASVHAACVESGTLGTILQGVRVLGSSAQYNHVNDYATSLNILNELKAIKFVDKRTNTQQASPSLAEECDKRIIQVQGAQAEKERSLESALLKAIHEKGEWTSEFRQLEVYFLGDPSDRFRNIISEVGLTQDGKKLKIYTQPELERVFASYSLEAVQKVFPNDASLNKPEINEFTAAIETMISNTGKSVQAINTTIGIVDYLYRLSTPRGGPENTAVSPLLRKKQQELRLALGKTLSNNLKDAVAGSDDRALQSQLKEFEKYFIGESKPGDRTYPDNHKRFVDLIDKYGLDANGNRKVQPAPVEAVAPASSSSSSSSSSSPEITKQQVKAALGNALKAVGRTFSSPLSTEESFEESLDLLKKASKNFTSQYPLQKDMTDVELLSDLLCSITMRAPNSDRTISLLEYAYVKGIRTVEDDGEVIVNPQCVNEPVLITFEAALTEKDRLKLLRKIPKSEIQEKLKVIVADEIKRLQDIVSLEKNEDQKQKHVKFEEPQDVVDVEYARKQVAEVFVDPNATPELFLEAYEYLETALAIKLVKEGIDNKDDNVALIQTQLLSITVPDGPEKLLEYVARKGLRTDDNPDGVNPAVHQQFLSLAGPETVQAVLPDIMAVSASSSSSSRVKYVAVPSEEDIQPDGVKANPPNDRLRALYRNIVDAVTLPEGTMSAFHNSIGDLQAYHREMSSTNAQVAFISGLKNLTVLPSNKSLLLLAIELPTYTKSEETKRNAIVASLHQYLGAEIAAEKITNGFTENDPLVTAARLGKAKIVETLLPFYADPAHWKDDAQRAAVKECLKAALAQLEQGCVDFPKKFLPVFDKFKHSEELCALALGADAKDGVFGQRINEVSASIDQGLMKNVSQRFSNPNTPYKDFRVALDDLKRYYRVISKTEAGANALYLNALDGSADSMDLVVYAANRGVVSESNPGGVNAMFLEHVLAELVEGGLFEDPDKRQALYTLAKDQREARGVIRSAFTHTSVLALSMSAADLQDYIVDLVRSPKTTALQFHETCNKLKEQLQAENPSMKTEALNALLALKLRDIKFNVEQKAYTLSSYVETLPPQSHWHGSVATYLGSNTTPAKPTWSDTYKSSAATGAKWATGMVALAIVGVLAEAFLFGEDRNMENKLYSLANWCWKNPFSNSSELSAAGHSESHEAEMLTCVGSLALVAGAFIGAALGAGAKGVKQQMKKP